MSCLIMTNSIDITGRPALFLRPDLLWRTVDLGARRGEEIGRGKG